MERDVRKEAFLTPHCIGGIYSFHILESEDGKPIKKRKHIRGGILDRRSREWRDMTTIEVDEKYL